MTEKQTKPCRPATGKDPLISFRLPADELRQIDEIATGSNMTRSRAIRELIARGIHSLSAPVAPATSDRGDYVRRAADRAEAMSKAKRRLL